MKRFDENFSRKAKEAFDSFNADYLAEEGWNSYVRKQAKKRNRVIALPLWVKVATIAVLVTVGVLFTARLNHQKAVESVSQTSLENRSGLTESAINEQSTAAASPVIADSDQASETTISKAGQSRYSGREKTGYQDSEAAVSLAEAAKAEESPFSETARAAGSLLTETVVAARAPLTDTSVAARSPFSETGLVAVMSPKMELPDNPVEISITDGADTRLKLKPREVQPVLADIPREKLTTTIMTGLSGMMASIGNATSTSQGVSIGFYVEQQLTRRISVRPGLAMARHNYAMESTSDRGTVMDYAAPELNGLSGTTTSYEADIEIVSMELPVNFVFSIRKRARSNLFVTTGASTLVYLSQNMSGSYNNTYTRSTVDASTGELSYDSMTTTVMIESEQEPLNRIDFLGLANFSAGYSFPFAKTSNLLFEPFVQLPIKDLTSLNLRIRYGGLSMKIKF